MFQVVTVNLATDTSGASSAHGVIDVGELTRDEFAALLERFRGLDSIKNHEPDPLLLVAPRAENFRIRPGGENLPPGTAPTPVDPFVEPPADEIIRQLEHV